MFLKYVLLSIWASAIICGTATLSRAVPLPEFPVVHEHPWRRETCGFDGNSDLYGLGIRLGVYFQWISAFMIHCLGLEGRDEIMEAYAVFLTALTIAIIVATAQSQPVYAVEVFILTYIIFGGAYAVLIPSYKSSNLIDDFQSGGQRRKLRAVVIMVILAAVSIYCCWFWLRGIFNTFLPTPCGTYGFLFAKVSLLNPSVTKFFAFLSILMAGTYTTWPLTVRLLPMAERLRYHIRAKGGKIPTEIILAYFYSRNPLNIVKDSAAPLASILGPVTSVVTIVWSILGIELTLYWNYVQGVYSIRTTGQLIPFVIGLMGLIVILLNTAVRVMGHRHEADEATVANKRLRYLDLIQPIEAGTVRRAQCDFRKSRTEKVLRYLVT
jgi:hypothetical protein